MPQDSIKTSQQWFMACPPHLAAALVSLMARRLMGLPEYDRQLHIIYLANDILFKALQTRKPPGSPSSEDTVASAFLPALGPMLAAAYQRGGRAEEVRGGIRWYKEGDGREGRSTGWRGRQRLILELAILLPQLPLSP